MSPAGTSSPERRPAPLPECRPRARPPPAGRSHRFQHRHRRAFGQRGQGEQRKAAQQRGDVGCARRAARRILQAGAATCAQAGSSGPSPTMVRRSAVLRQHRAQRAKASIRQAWFLTSCMRATVPITKSPALQGESLLHAAWREALGIDAVAIRMIFARDATTWSQPALAGRPTPGRSGRSRAPAAAQQVVLRVQAVRVAGVASVLGVDPHRHAGQRRGERIFDGGQVIGVQHGRRRRRSSLPQFQVGAQAQAGRLVERVQFDVRAADALRRTRCSRSGRRPHAGTGAPACG
jgi:hypothetical protein